MTDTDRLRRLTTARQRFTSACKKAWIRHTMGDITADDLETAFQAERIKMLRLMMEILPAGEDDDPAFLAQTPRPAVGQRRAAG